MKLELPTAGPPITPSSEIKEVDKRSCLNLFSTNHVARPDCMGQRNGTSVTFHRLRLKNGVFSHKERHVSPQRRKGSLRLPPCLVAVNAARDVIRTSVVANPGRHCAWSPNAHSCRVTQPVDPPHYVVVHNANYGDRTQMMLIERIVDSDTVHANRIPN